MSASAGRKIAVLAGLSAIVVVSFVVFSSSKEIVERYDQWNLQRDPPFGLPLVASSAVVFLIDRSSSMEATGLLDVAKREMSRSIGSFSERIEFGVIFFDRGVLRFPEAGAPARATEEAKDTASTWVERVPGGNGSAFGWALPAALELVAASSTTPRVIIYVGDGGEASQGLFDAARKNSSHSVVVHTVAIRGISPNAEALLRNLADQTGGQFTNFSTPEYSAKE